MKLLILSIGRDIASGAERLLGHKADSVIKVGEIEPDQYPEVRQRIYHYFKEWQNESIELVLSGPIAFAFTLGQLVGLNHFDIIVHHYDADNKKYHRIPMPSRKEII